MGERMPAEWLPTLDSLLPGRLTRTDRLHGGDSSDVFRLRGPDFDLVLHVLPPWMRRERVDWVESVVRHVHATVPEAIPPLPRSDAHRLRLSGRLLTLSPYVSGTLLDRGNEFHRSSAARVLAGIHQATSGWLGAPDEVPASEGARLRSAPDELEDEVLMSWWRSIGPGLVRAVTHGDFYRGNVICEGERVVGVVDWHEARVQPLLAELAASTFEMCRDESHVLNVDQARAFIREYRSSGGVVPVREYTHLVRAMRVWVRRDAMTSLAHSGGVKTEYTLGQIRAFDDLRALEAIDGELARD